MPDPSICRSIRLSLLLTLVTACAASAVQPAPAPADRAFLRTIQQPATDVYAVLDVDRGDATRNLTPDEAMATFEPEGRSPLTITEGIAYLLHYPHALRKNHCFQTAGSRREDRRVPGIWISNRAPKVGFCWAGNRHTWLGIASGAGRVPA